MVAAVNKGLYTICLGNYNLLDGWYNTYHLPMTRYTLLYFYFTLFSKFLLIAVPCFLGYLSGVTLQVMQMPNYAFSAVDVRY